MCDRGLRRGVSALAAVAVLACASTADAQDYVVSRLDDVFADPPANATDLGLTGIDVVEVQLPFSFPYYGAFYDSFWVTGWGYLVIDPPGGTAGRSYANPAWPPHGSTVGQFLDGAVAPYWDNFDLDISGDMFFHVEGTEPERTVVVTWLNCTLRAGAADLSFQVRLEEGTGVIEFGYKADTVPSTWPSDSLVSNYGIGIVAPLLADERFVVPPGFTVVAPPNSGHPGRDIRFVPDETEFTGRLVMDVLVSDATGIGNTVLEDVAVADTTIELRWSAPAGRVVVLGSTDAEGRFSLTGLGLPDDGVLFTGTLSVLTEAPSSTVRATAGGDPLQLDVLTGIAFGAEQQLGDVPIDAANDPSGDFRSALNVMRIVAAARDFATTHSMDEIPHLDILLDSADAGPTAYTPTDGMSDPFLRVASSGSTNPDPWDDAVVTRAYGRHVLDCISALPSTEADSTFDGVTDPENALAEAWRSATTSTPR